MIHHETTVKTRFIHHLILRGMIIVIKSMTVKFKQETFKDTKGVVRSCKSRKCQQHNEIERNNDLQTTTRKTKDLLARTPTKP